MIKAVKKEGPGGVPLVMLGLSHANLDRLREGEPIRLDVEQCGGLGLGQNEIVVFSGANEVDMTAELEGHGLLPPGSAARTKQALDRRD